MTKTAYKFIQENMKSKNGNLIKAIKSQKLVVDLLKRNGFIISEVNHPNSNGKDIVAIKGNFNCSIEVKSVIRNTRSWIVKKPKIDCDYIAIVFPNDYIHIELVTDWMKLCNPKSGVRNVTSLFKIFKELK